MRPMTSGYCAVNPPVTSTFVFSGRAQEAVGVEEGIKVPGTFIQAREAAGPSQTLSLSVSGSSWSLGITDRMMGGKPRGSWHCSQVHMVMCVWGGHLPDPTWARTPPPIPQSSSTTRTQQHQKLVCLI